MIPKSFEEPFRSGNFDWITNFAIKKRPIDIKTEIIAKIIFSSTISFDYFFSISMYNRRNWNFGLDHDLIVE